MNPKGPPLDLEIAEAGTSRRSLIRAVGAAGIAGAAIAWTSESTVASTDVPTDGDTLLLAEAMALELAARDLYRLTLETSIGDDTAVLVNAMATNHGAYAQSIAGATGLSANARNEEVFAANEAAFFTTDFELAAHALEQTAVATHTALLGMYESRQAIDLTASILVVEARHATVLADLAGVSDFDVLFANTEPALEPSGGVG